MIRKEKIEQAKSIIPNNLGKKPSKIALWEQIHALSLNEEELIELLRWLEELKAAATKTKEIIEMDIKDED